MQLDVSQRKLRVNDDLFKFEDFIKKFDYSDWIIEETIVDGFKQRKANRDKITDDELERLATEAQ
jgi:hypothetical protein